MLLLSRLPSFHSFIIPFSYSVRSLVLELQCNHDIIIKALLVTFWNCLSYHLPFLLLRRCIHQYTYTSLSWRRHIQVVFAFHCFLIYWKYKLLYSECVFCLLQHCRNTWHLSKKDTVRRNGWTDAQTLIAKPICSEHFSRKPL